MSLNAGMRRLFSQVGPRQRQRQKQQLEPGAYNFFFALEFIASFIVSTQIFWSLVSSPEPSLASLFSLYFSMMTPMNTFSITNAIMNWTIKYHAKTKCG